MAREDVEIRHLIRATRRSLVPPPFPPRRDLAFAGAETRCDGDEVLFHDVFWVRRWRICCCVVRLRGGHGMAAAHVLKALLRAAMRRHGPEQAMALSLGALQSFDFAALSADAAAVVLQTDTGEAAFATTGTGAALRLAEAGTQTPGTAAPVAHARLECGQFVWLSVGDVARPTSPGACDSHRAADLVRAALAGVRGAAAVVLGLKSLHQERERTFTLGNDVGGISPILVDVTDFLLAEGVSEDALTGLDLALDEVLTNIVLYAYHDGQAHEIIVHLSLEDDALRVEVQDDGMPFDPTAAAATDTDSSLEDRPIGGLGLHFVRMVFDSMNYHRVRGWNTLVLAKRLIAPSRDQHAMVGAEPLSRGAE